MSYARYATGKKGVGAGVFVGAFFTLVGVILGVVFMKKPADAIDENAAKKPTLWSWVSWVIACLCCLVAVASGFGLIGKKTQAYSSY